MTHRRTTRALVALLATTALVLAACGDDDDVATGDVDAGVDDGFDAVDDTDPGETFGTVDETTPERNDVENDPAADDPAADDPGADDPGADDPADDTSGEESGLDLDPVLQECVERLRSGDFPTFTEPPAVDLDPAATYTATFVTNKGDVVVELDTDIAPETVANFVGLAEADYYDCTFFHRIIPGFMIQGGDPTATGTGGPGYAFDDELPPDSDCGPDGLQQGGVNAYPAGSLAMANSGPGTNGSQFFIVTGDAGHLCSHTRFGHVVEGQDVADAVAAEAGSPSGDPIDLVAVLDLQIARS